MSKNQSVSLIIPTLNGEFWFNELLSGIVHQTLVPDEVIVIDSGSSDATIPLVHRYMEVHPFIRLYQIKKEEFDHGGTRTMAARKATGDILVFMTQDAIPADNMALELLIRSFAKDDNMAAAYGRQLPAKNATFFSEHLRLFNYPEQSQIRSQQDWGLYGFKTVFISNSFAAWRRDILEQQGYFPEHLLFGEDTVALAKMLEKGYYVAYVSEAIVYHSHNYSVLQDFKRYFDIGVLHETQSRYLLQHKGPGGTGKKYILSELACLAKKRKYYLLPEFLLRNFCKFIAYHMGKRFRIFPDHFPARLSMNPGWWL